MLGRFPTLQVAIACFSCSPPDLNFFDAYFIFTYVYAQYPLPPSDSQLEVIIIIIIIIIIIKYRKLLIVHCTHTSESAHVKVH
jgi:NhaP-type Na+/H+ or K+/H+ antiporter